MFATFRKSASCTHISALLHALVSMTASQFQLQPTAGIPEADLLGTDDETVPVTSQPCQWKQPRKRKESTMPLAEAPFEKHVYGKENKRKLKPLEDFDPRPVEFRGTVRAGLPALLEKIRGENLCVSLLFDDHFRHWDGAKTVSEPALPNIVALRETVQAFKDSLTTSGDTIHRIECDTRNQRNSPFWYEVRRYRITASIFGVILRRRPDTPPDALVLKILQPKQFKSAATEWGVHQEPLAIQEYIRHQQGHGHPNLSVAPCGFHISKSHPYLGATPDGVVYDPLNLDEPFGFLEVKCPYSHRSNTPEEASSTSGFCCSLEANSDGAQQLYLRRNHIYYAQVQGQMGVGGKPWCDFVVYTTKGISVQRIQFDKDYWENILLPKLIEFYDNILGPEIVSPVHVLGLPIRNLK